MKWFASAMVGAIGVAVLASVGFAQQTPVTPGVKEAEAAKIREALPATPAAKPAQARKILAFTLTNGFHHSSIPCGIYAITAMGEKTGAYTVVQSEDPAVFEADNLKQFDVILMLNTTGDSFMPKGTDKAAPDVKKAATDKAMTYRKNVLDFVNGGKGLAGIHAATDTLYNWPEYGEMIGGYFNGHPWHELVAVKVEDPTHPINAFAFEGKAGFAITDEIYRFRNPWSREKLRVLTSLDYDGCNQIKPGMMAKDNKGDGTPTRPDKDFGVSWVRTQGQGRVFYCSLGHREEIYWNPAIMKHYLAGLQFALGDLKAETSPIPQRK